jgi:hypothetical protein
MPDGSLVSVAMIQASMCTFEGMQIPDPLDGGYRDGALVAVIFPWGIHSMAHGGYSLRFVDEIFDAENEPFIYELDEVEDG